MPMTAFLDVAGRPVKPGNWLLYKVSSDHGHTANWIIRRVESVDENAGKIRVTGPNMNPASNGHPNRAEDIEYRTKTCPQRLLLVLDSGEDTLYPREQEDVPLIDLGLRGKR
jgi:hypothetical protein